jgi:hypothetical protein
MDYESDRKSHAEDQLHMRIGKQFLDEFNAYMKTHDGTKVDVIRKAVRYWMSIDGNPGALPMEITHLRDKVKSLERSIQDKEQLLVEKDRVIAALVDGKETLDRHNKVLYHLLAQSDPKTIPTDRDEEEVIKESPNQI